jgi:hypothetical protein
LHEESRNISLSIVSPRQSLHCFRPFLLKKTHLPDMVKENKEKTFQKTKAPCYLHRNSYRNRILKETLKSTTFNYQRNAYYKQKPKLQIYFKYKLFTDNGDGIGLKYFLFNK